MHSSIKSEQDIADGMAVFVKASRISEPELSVSFVSDEKFQEFQSRKWQGEPDVTEVERLTPTKIGLVWKPPVPGKWWVLLPMQGANLQITQVPC